MTTDQWEAFAVARLRTRNGDATAAWSDVFDQNVAITARMSARPSLRSLRDAISGFTAARARMGL